MADRRRYSFVLYTAIAVAAFVAGAAGGTRVRLQVLPRR